MNKPKTVWVLNYSHEFGVDTQVFDSEDKAGKAAIESMKQWINDLERLDKKYALKIKKAIKNGDYHAAVNYWSVYTEETYTIDQLPVQ